MNRPEIIRFTMLRNMFSPDLIIVHADKTTKYVDILNISGQPGS